MFPISQLLRDTMIRFLFVVFHYGTTSLQLVCTTYNCVSRFHCRSVSRPRTAGRERKNFQSTNRKWWTFKKKKIKTNWSRYLYICHVRASITACVSSRALATRISFRRYFIIVYTRFYRNVFVILLNLLLCVSELIAYATVKPRSSANRRILLFYWNFWWAYCRFFQLTAQVCWFSYESSVIRKH